MQGPKAYIQRESPLLSMHVTTVFLNFMATTVSFHAPFRVSRPIQHAETRWTAKNILPRESQFAFSCGSLLSCTVHEHNKSQFSRQPPTLFVPHFMFPDLFNIDKYSGRTAKRFSCAKLPRIRVGNFERDCPLLWQVGIKTILKYFSKSLPFSITVSLFWLKIWLLNSQVALEYSAALFRANRFESGFPIGSFNHEYFENRA
jgi:hypothetical protein